MVEKLTVENGELKLSSDYHPLGVAFDVNPSTGQRTLLTVNLAHKSGPSIEVFDVKDTKLVYKKPISHPEIYSPNSVHVISDSRLRADDGTPSFFFSNDHYFSSGILKMIENYFFYLSNVKFYNARTGEVQKAVDGLLFANGVSGTDDTLFVAEVHKMDIKQYKINVKTTPKLHVSLDFIKEKKFEMGVDNVAYNPKTNQVIVAGHPKSLQTVIYISTANKEGVAMPPSQVAAWDLDSNQVKILFEDDGSYFGSSTAGAIDAVNSKLLASGLYEEGLLVCDL